MKTASKYSMMWIMQIGVAIIISYSVVSYVKNAILESQQAVSHTRNVINKLNKVSEMLLNAETGQRGYIITSKEKYLDPYNFALDRIGQDLYDLKVLISDDPQQYSRYLELEKTTHNKLQELRNTIYIKETSPPSIVTKRINNDVGFNMMNRFRSIMKEIVDYEEKKLEKHQNEEITSLKLMTLVIPLLIVGDFILLILAYYLIREQETTEIKKFIDATIAKKNSTLEYTP